jgi:hypothetical protein
MLAKSETVSAVLRAKSDVQRAEAGAIARGLMMLFQIIPFLRPVGCGHCDDLADRNCGCARTIAVPVERLLRTPEATITDGLLMSEFHTRVNARRLTFLQIYFSIVREALGIMLWLRGVNFGLEESSLAGIYGRSSGQLEIGRSQ